VSGMFVWTLGCHIGLLTSYRTINIIALVDCAFSFYSNFPCRLTPAELECDMPCEDSIFGSKHPFAHPNFRFTRETTVYEAFRYLFQNEEGASSMGFTVTDMFFLIHRKRISPFSDKNIR
jgi:hypothetical protein